MRSEVAGRGTAGASALPQTRLAKPGFAEEAIPCLDAVYRFALRLAHGNEAEAADIVQETYLRAYRGWHTYQRGTRIHSWLFTICRNYVRRQKLQEANHVEVTATDLGLDGAADLGAIAGQPAPGPWEEEKALFDGMVDRTVLAAIDALPDEFRESIILRDMHGLSCGEIADVLQVPEGTVKSRLHRGRRILYHALRPYAIEIGFIGDGLEGTS